MLGAWVSIAHIKFIPLLSHCISLKTTALLDPKSDCLRRALYDQMNPPAW